MSRAATAAKVAERKQVVEVRRIDTQEVVKRIETTLTGGAYDRFFSGLLRKVDTDRFYVAETEVKP